MYAKLINGELREAPYNYRGIINYNKYPERMAEDGYKPVENTPMPSDGQDEYDYTDEDNPVLVKEAKKRYEPHWEEQEDKIVQVWEEVTEVEPEDNDVQEEQQDQEEEEANDARRD